MVVGDLVVGVSVRHTGGHSGRLAGPPGVRSSQSRLDLPDLADLGQQLPHLHPHEINVDLTG